MYIILYYISWRWGSENEKDCINKVSNLLDMNFISIKKAWSGHLVTFLFSSKGILHFVLISSKGIPQHFDSHPCIRPPSWVGDTMNSKQRRSSELGGHEWALWIHHDKIQSPNHIMQYKLQLSMEDVEKPTSPFIFTCS